jgi:hypothetical protein
MNARGLSCGPTQKATAYIARPANSPRYPSVITIVTSTGSIRSYARS